MTFLEWFIIGLNIITFLFSPVSEQGFRNWVGISYGSLLGYFIAHIFIL